MAAIDYSAASLVFSSEISHHLSLFISVESNDELGSKINTPILPRRKRLISSGDIALIKITSEALKEKYEEVLRDKRRKALGEIQR